MQDASEILSEILLTELGKNILRRFHFTSSNYLEMLQTIQHWF